MPLDGVAFSRLDLLENSGREGFKNGKIFTSFFFKFNQCVNSFQDDLVKRLYKVDA